MINATKLLKGTDHYMHNILVRKRIVELMKRIGEVYGPDNVKRTINGSRTMVHPILYAEIWDIVRPGEPCDVTLPPDSYLVYERPDTRDSKDMLMMSRFDMVMSRESAIALGYNVWRDSVLNSWSKV